MSGPRDDPDLRIRRALEPWLASDAALVLAVSGGPDSTALMHAAAGLRPRSLFVATVDHGLRPEAADEARAVGRAAEASGLPHTILRWEGPHPETAIQAAARSARYRLLAAHAVAVGATHVLTGHTRDDQAETVLMRLVAGSGPAGLAGMRRERPLAGGIVLARPFLTLSKADLVAWCAARGLAFVHDPSNRDDRYGRVRLRRLLPLLATEGLTADRLATLAERAARDDAALSAAADAAFATAWLPRAAMDDRGSPFPRGEGHGRASSGEVGPLTRALSPEAYRIHTSPKLQEYPTPSFRGAAGEPGTHSRRGSRIWHRRRLWIPGSASQPREDGFGADHAASVRRCVNTVARTGEGAAGRFRQAARTSFEDDGPHTAPLPPPSAGEGGPRVSEGRERGAPSQDTAFPSPDLARGPPSPASGGGRNAAAVRLHGPALAALPDAIALRVMDRALDEAGGTLPRRLERLERLVLGELLPALLSGRAVRRTLRGLLITADAAGPVTIRPAPPRRGDGLAAGSPDLLGKGEPSAYIGPACADGPAAAGSRPTRPRD